MGWQEYTEELYKKDLHDPDNHNGVITHTYLEPDILECEVKWALRSITTNKASGDDGIPVELFQILKDEARLLEWVAISFTTVSSPPRDGTWVSGIAGESLPSKSPVNVTKAVSGIYESS